MTGCAGLEACVLVGWCLRLTRESEVDVEEAVLRRLLGGPRPVVLAGAHDGLTARLVEEAGFDGIWASGFEISASHGVPDASLLSMSDHLAAIRIMSEAAGLPIVADCDTGFGNAVNAVRMTRLYEAAHVAGISIEDAVFPKRCSFYSGVRRTLAPVAEQVLKLRACCEARRGDMVVVARTEALVAGRTLDEALRRARAYADAGVDAMLIHSKASTPDEVFAFAAAWDRPVPLVAVPTVYHTVSADELFQAGIRMVVFANHGVRALVRAVQDVFRTLRAEGRPSAVASQISTIAEVSRLVGVDRLRALEAAYLPRTAEEEENDEEGEGADE